MCYAIGCLPCKKEKAEQKRGREQKKKGPVRKGMGGGRARKKKLKDKEENIPSPQGKEDRDI